MKNLIALTMAALAAVACADAPQILNLAAKQRYPWNGKVDITFEVAGDLTNGVPAWNTPVFSLSATNRADSNKSRGMTPLPDWRRKLYCASFRAMTYDLFCPWLPSRFMG